MQEFKEDKKYEGVGGGGWGREGGGGVGRQPVQEKSLSFNSVCTYLHIYVLGQIHKSEHFQVCFQVFLVRLGL